MNVISRIREIITKMDASVYSGCVGDEDWREVSDILDAYAPEGYSVEVVDRSFDDGGRWTNVTTEVYEVEQDGVIAYFERWREVPATEMQEGGGFSFDLQEVEPREVTSIRYVVKKKEAV